MHTVFWNIKSGPGEGKQQYEEGIGAYKLAWIAKENGKDSIVLQDHNYAADAELISARTDALDPEILCYSVLSYGMPLLKELAIRDIQRGVPIIVGGVGATIEPLSVLELYDNATFPVAIVQGDGEEMFRKLMSTPPESWSSIDGIFTWNNGAKVEGTLQRCSLDASPFSLLESSDQRKIASESVQNLSLPLERRIAWQRSLLTTQVESRKGCYYQCGFCSTSSMPDKHVRKSSPGRLVREIEYLAERGIGFIALTDNIAFDYPQWWDECAHMLRDSGIAPFIQFGGYGTPRMLDKPEWEQTMKNLYQVGLRGIILGVQAGSPRILREIIGRPADDPARALALVKRYVPLGINVKLDFIVGHPAETIDDLRDTLTWIRKINLAGGEVFVRELNIVPHSRYQKLLDARHYELPKRTPEYENLIKEILSQKEDDSNYLARAFNDGVPNKYLIDRDKGIRYPCPLFSIGELNHDKSLLKTSEMPEALKERYEVLYDLVLERMTYLKA